LRVFPTLSTLQNMGCSNSKGVKSKDNFGELCGVNEDPQQKPAEKSGENPSVQKEEQK